MSRFVCTVFFLGFVAITALPAQGVVLFQDDFDTFTLGTTWTASYGVEPSPNVALYATTNDSRTVLYARSNGGITQGYAVVKSGLSVPLGMYSDLTYTAVFNPFGVAYEPFETGIEGAELVRFFTWNNAWASHGTTLPFESNGSFNYGTYYRGTIHISDAGTSIEIVEDADPSQVVYTRNYAALTRQVFGDSLYIYIRQVTGDGNPNNTDPEVFIDSVTLEATPIRQVEAVPEPLTLSMGLMGAVGLAVAAGRRRRR